MTTRVVTVPETAPVKVAVDRMKQYGFSALPVVDPSYRLVGIISLIDVIRFREDQPDFADGVPVASVMNPDVLSMAPTTNLAIVAHRLRRYGELRVMPVVSGGRLVGVVTRGDLLRPRQKAGWLATLRRRVRGGDSAEDEVLLTLARPRPPGPAPKASTPVRDVMTLDVVTVVSTQSVAQAAALLVRHRFTALPVVDDQHRLVGVVSEADLLGDPLFDRSAPGVVATVMTRVLITIDAGATIGDARSLVAERGLRVLPVVKDGRLVGVLSRSDLV